MDYGDWRVESGDGEESSGRKRGQVEFLGRVQELTRTLYASGRLRWPAGGIDCCQATSKVLVLILVLLLHLFLSLFVSNPSLGYEICLTLGAESGRCRCGFCCSRERDIFFDFAPSEDIERGLADCKDLRVRGLVNAGRWTLDSGLWTRQRRVRSQPSNGC